jgi:hypothetical protein
MPDEKVRGDLGNAVEQIRQLPAKPPCSIAGIDRASSNRKR